MCMCKTPAYMVAPFAIPVIIRAGWRQALDITLAMMWDRAPSRWSAKREQN